jgi:glycosyltransferase involved in cell wall biosynthesis
MTKFQEKQPLVSVLMPYYKGEKYMEEAILSVTNQTYKNIEIIVINDSPESQASTEYLISLQNKYDFKLIHHEHNMGLTKALSTGFKHSKGDYISILGQDDLFVPEKTQTQLDFFEKNDSYIWVYGNMEWWNTKNNKRKTPKVDETIKKIKEKTMIPALYYGNSFKGLYSQGSMGKRQVFENDIMPLWHKLTADVWPVNIRLFEKYPDQIGLIEQPMTIYRLHDTNTVNNKAKMFALIIPTIVEMCPQELQKDLIESHLHLIGIQKKTPKYKKFFSKIAKLLKSSK